MIWEPTIRQIIQMVAKRHGVTVDQILGPQRGARFVRARHEAMARCVSLNKWSLPQIGRAFNRDHTTVLYAARKMGVK